MVEALRHWLRPLQEEDCKVIASFEREIAKISFPDDPITDLDFYVKKLKQLLNDENAATFVVDSDSGPIGWAYVRKRQNFITKVPYADFNSIYVAPSLRGSGVVSELMNAVFHFCLQQRLDRVVFRTRATNERMKAVLTRSGFAPTQIYYEKEFQSSARQRDEATPGTSFRTDGRRNTS
jgi:RimJ/RimL family protein N-acetyltransferase